MYFFRKNYMKKDLRRREMLLFFTIKMAAMMSRANQQLRQQKNALYLRVNVFSTKVLIRDTILNSPTGDGTVILPVHPSHAKV